MNPDSDFDMKTLKSKLDWYNDIDIQSDYLNPFVKKTHAGKRLEYRIYRVLLEPQTIHNSDQRNIDEISVAEILIHMKQKDTRIDSNSTEKNHEEK